VKKLYLTYILLNSLNLKYLPYSEISWLFAQIMIFILHIISFNIWNHRLLSPSSSLHILQSVRSVWIIFQINSLFCIPTTTSTSQDIFSLLLDYYHISHSYSQPVFPMFTVSYAPPLINLPKILFHFIISLHKIPEQFFSAYKFKFQLPVLYSGSYRIHSQICSFLFLHFFYMKQIVPVDCVCTQVCCRRSNAGPHACRINAPPPA
jgi:hypothetical protein